MSAPNIAGRRSFIKALPQHERALLRARAENPFTTADTGFFRTTGKPGDRALYIAYRPNRKTKVSLGAPSDVLKCLDELSQPDQPTNVESPDAPVSLPPVDVTPLLPEPPKTPEGGQLPKDKPTPPGPAGHDNSWRIPATFGSIAAVAAMGIALYGISEGVAAKRGNEIGSGAYAVVTTLASLPHVAATRESAANGLSGKNTPSLVAAQKDNAPAAADDLAAVFAALNGARCQDSFQATAILEAQPAAHPVLPRSSETLRWPDSALVRGVSKNLRSAGYSHGVLTLWVVAPAILASAMKTGDSVMGSLAGWTDRGWEYSVQADRIEIREARR